MIIPDTAERMYPIYSLDRSTPFFFCNFMAQFFDADTNTPIPYLPCRGYHSSIMDVNFWAPLPSESDHIEPIELVDCSILSYLENFTPPVPDYDVDTDDEDESDIDDIMGDRDPVDDAVITTTKKVVKNVKKSTPAQDDTVANDDVRPESDTESSTSGPNGDEA